jgi:hypothetical protein
MRPETVSRRQLLQTATVGLSVGIIGQHAATASAADATGIIDSVNYRHGWAHIELSNPKETDTVRLINPHGQQVGQTRVKLAETAASFDLLDDGSYTGGRYTIETYSGAAGAGKRLGRGAFSAQPQLSVIGFETNADGWPQIYVQNTGSGPARIQALRCAGGFPTPGRSATPQGDLPIDPGVMLFIEYKTDGKPPTTTTKKSELQEYAGKTIPAEIGIETLGFDTSETRLDLTWSKETRQKSRENGEGTIHFCTKVRGGEIP